MFKRNIFHYKGYKIPINLMKLTGGGPDTFDAISKMHINNIEKYIGIKDNFSVIEIGCGIGRDAIPLTKILSSNGSYLGIDIMSAVIDWCSKNISTRFPNFKFLHFDVKDQLHNPNGTISMEDVKIPLEDNSVDLIILQSVFTHLLANDIQKYLREFHRLLKPSGRVYATMFIINDDILSSARSTDRTAWNLKFYHEVGEGCRINDINNPTGAVAYTYEALLQLILSAGLKLARPLLKGEWSGYYSNPDDGQDVAILSLAAEPLE